MSPEEVIIQRNAVTKEAAEWNGTPYVERALVKGRNGGADCLTFFTTAFFNAGVMERLEIPYYSGDWHMHHAEERYLEGFQNTKGVLHYFTEVTDRDPLPGDLILFKFGLCYSHAAICMEWPVLIHAMLGSKCGYVNIEQSIPLRKIFEIPALRHQPRPRKTFMLKTWVQP